MIALILILFAGSSFDKITPEFRQEIENLSSAAHTPKFKQIIETMSQDERLKVTSWLKQQIGLPDNPRPIDETNLLIELGDNETIAKEVQKFPDAPGWGESPFFNSNQPKVITVIASSMFVNEPLIVNHDTDAPSYPKSFETARAIRQVLAHSPYFSLEVNQWAKSWDYPIGRLEKFRETMRKWWNANQRYFYAANYAAVQPGDPAPAETPATQLTPVSTAPSPSSSSALVPAPTLSPAPSLSSESEAHSSFPIVPVSIGIVGILAVAFLLRVRRQ